MDAWVAEYVMGFEVYIINRAVRQERTVVDQRIGNWNQEIRYLYHTPFSKNIDVPYFSKDIAVAWKALEKTREEVRGVDIYTRHNCWEVYIYLVDFNSADGYSYAEADTASLAICRASLIAVLSRKP